MTNAVFGTLFFIFGLGFVLFSRGISAAQDANLRKMTRNKKQSANGSSIWVVRIIGMGLCCVGVAAYTGAIGV